MIISDFLFVISALNLVSMALPGPYTVVWIMAIFLFLIEITLAISYDDEDSLKKVGLMILMYVSYCQLWMYIVIRAIYQEYIKKEKRTWTKTVRFETPPER
jgi:hypothetical protein